VGEDQLKKEPGFPCIDRNSGEGGGKRKNRGEKGGQKREKRGGEQPLFISPKEAEGLEMGKSGARVQLIELTSGGETEVSRRSY